MSNAKAQTLYLISVTAVGGSIVLALWRGC